MVVAFDGSTRDLHRYTANVVIGWYLGDARKVGNSHSSNAAAVGPTPAACSPLGVERGVVVDLDPPGVGAIGASTMHSAADAGAPKCAVRDTSSGGLHGAPIERLEARLTIHAIRVV